MYNLLMLIKRRVWIGFFLLLALSLALPQTGLALTPASISILEPGEGSVVTSSIHISAEVEPGGDNLIRVTLIAIKDNLLARKLLKVNPVDNETPIHFETNLAYEIPTETTTALLTIATQDEYHRPQSLRSITLTLKTDGQASIKPQTSTDPWLVIDEPAPLETLGGGQVTVSGTITPVNDNPVRLELIKYNGAVIGSTQLLVMEPGESFDFEVVLPYAYVTTTTDIRLIIRQTAEEFASNKILDSIQISLTP